MKPERIPIFPLELVLFPGMPLPLHIFEPRYKLMIGRCLERRAEFGVVLAKPQGIAAVGCTAEIIKVLKKYPDGRMDILAAGQTAYHVLEVFEEQPYLEANVEYLDDDLASEQAAAQKLVALFQQCYHLIHGQNPQLPDPGAGSHLAFQVARELPFELEYKQQILELPAEAERQASLIEQMEQWLPRLAQLARVRQRAGGNGHGLA